MEVSAAHKPATPLRRPRLFVTRDLPSSEQFRKHAAAFDQAPLCRPFDAMASLVADFLRHAEATLPYLSDNEVAGVAEATQSLIVALMNSIPENVERARGALARATLTRARRIVRQNLHEPGLDAKTLSRSLGISRSALYRAFEPHGGVAAFIRQERLNEAHVRLVSSPSKTIVGTLAAELGFTDHSSFTRAFKQHFGYSPRKLLSSAQSLSVGTRDLATVARRAQSP